MARFHITPSGDPKVCRAKPGGCRYGADADHYPSQDEARAAFEAQVAEAALPKVKKTAPVDGDPYAALSFPVQEIDGAQMLSQGSANFNELRMKSDSYNNSLFTVTQAEAIGVSYFKGKCACGKKLFVTRSKKWVNVSPQNTDHILSASAGHLAAAGNVQALCPRCNSTLKNNRSFEHLYDALVDEGLITVEEGEAGKARTRDFVENIYLESFPELRALKEAGDQVPNRNEPAQWERYKSQVSLAYADLIDAERISPKTSALYEKQYGDTEIWKTLDDVGAIMDALGSTSEQTAKAVHDRKQHLQSAWEETIGREVSIKDINKEDWRRLNQAYLSRYARSNPEWDKGSTEFGKAKRALRVFAIIADREDFEEYTKALPGYAGFDWARGA